MPAYKGLNCLSALANFYDISWDEASMLFNNGEIGQRNVATPKGAAKRLRDFVRNKEREQCSKSQR